MEALTKQLADAQRCGVYQLIHTAEEIERAAKHAGLSVFRIDIGPAKDKKDFLALLAKALSFPAWFGGNWDALSDCLRDLDALSTPTGYVVILENSERFAARCPQEYDTAKSVFQNAAEHWKTEGRPFWIFIATSRTWDTGLPRWPRH